MSAPENPPAFPLGVPHMTEYQPEWGMSLRDYFAAKAMALNFGPMLGAPEVARHAYNVADAMLAARSTEFGNIGADGVQS